MDNDNEHNGLGIPDGYFNSLKTDILREVEIHELEKSLSPIKERNLGLSVPNNYFEDFKKFVGKQHVPLFKQGLLSRKLINWGIGIAACFTVIFTVNKYSGGFAPNYVSFDELLDELVMSQENISYLELEDLSEIISTPSFNTLEIEDNTYDFLLEDDEFLEDIAIDYYEI